MYQAWLSSESIRFRIRALKARFRGQKAELDAVKHHVRNGDTVCDIGANKGSFVYWLAHWVPDGRVVAFEPQPRLARRLADVCAAAKLSNVTVEAKAVTSHSGHQDLFIPTRHEPGASLQKAPDGEEFTKLSVPVVALDDYFGDAEPIALLKIDVEGAELDVLKGAERILRRHAPLLIFECENRHLAPDQDVNTVFSYLESLGYEGSFVCGNELLPISKFDPARHQPQDGEWFWKSKDYCNNFVFRKLPDPHAAAPR